MMRMERRWWHCGQAEQQQQQPLVGWSDNMLISSQQEEGQEGHPLLQNLKLEELEEHNGSLHLFWL